MNRLSAIFFSFFVLVSGLGCPDAIAQSVVHPSPGASLKTEDVDVTFVKRKQNFGFKEGRDKNILSPKSVNIHPSGKKYYVNSLEGARTVVYDAMTDTCLCVINHKFTAADSLLWASESGFFKFTHYHRNLTTFSGKPVESTFSHGGRYLWVPYYRRSFDLNSQDPSAVAVIDTDKDEIIRLFETGPLPKMIAVSPDGTRIAVTHWGDNTVGMLDISSPRPSDWKYTDLFVVDKQLKLNFSLSVHVDRDSNSGYALRGTVFTNDNKYLFVSCMGGGGGIAVIDVENSKYLGRVMGGMPNMRHLVIDRGYLYASINTKGYVQKVSVKRFLEAVAQLSDDNRTVTMSDWQNCKVAAGARTIVLSPDGRFIFAACNFGNCISVVDAKTMKSLGSVPADSYPVGLDISSDGRTLISTSQGRSGHGGNAVDFFHIDYHVFKPM